MKLSPTSRSAALAWVAALGLLAAKPPSVDAAGHDLAVLVVGKNNEADLAAREKALIEQLTRSRSQHGLSHKLLPIYSYHFDKSVERSYCEERLKVKAGDLIVAGLVELEGGVPVRFVVRENGIHNPQAVATEILDRAQHELGQRGVATPAVAHKPAAPASPPVAASPSPAAARTPVAPRTPVAVRTPAGASTPVPATRPAAQQTEVPRLPDIKPATPPSHVVLKPTAPAHPPAGGVAPEPAKPAGIRSPEPPAARQGAEVKPPDTNPVAYRPSTPRGEALRPSSGGESWSIQLGMFSDLTKAQTYLNTVKSVLPQLEIRRGQREAATVFRVLTGTFSSQAEAYSRVKELKEEGITGFSVRKDATIGTVVP